MRITREKLSRAFHLAPLRLKKRILGLFREVRPDSVPVLLAGIQRSGTNMLLDVLEQSPDTLIYNENNRRAFKDYRIRDRECRLHLIKKSQYSVVIFKPLNDSNDINRLMEEHSDSKVLWMYRGYQDMVNSAVSGWGDFAINACREAAIGDREQGFIALTQSQIVRDYFTEGMDPYSAWALVWYLRNDIYFQCRLDKVPERVLLIKYEALVEEPNTQFMKVFDFLRITIMPDYLSRVFNNSVKKKLFPKIDPRIETLCEEMMERLDAAWERQGNVQGMNYGKGFNK